MMGRLLFCFFLFGNSFYFFFIVILIVFFIDFTKLFESFEEEIVRSSDVVVFIGIYAFDCLIFFEIVLMKKVQDFFVYGDL